MNIALKSAALVGAPSVALVNTDIRVMAGTASSTDPGIHNDDTRLSELARRILELRSEEIVALAECSRCHRILEQIRPDKPRVLLWRVGDPVRPTDFDAVKLENGSRYLWCNEGDIDNLASRSTPFVSWLFTGSADQWEALSRPDRPIHRYEHLFTSTPNLPKQKRAEELVNALSAWRQSVDDAWESSGYRAADARRSTISDAMSDMYDEMLSLRPVSIEGLRAIAYGLLYACWGGYIEVGESGEDGGLALLISALTGVKPHEAEAH